MRSANCTEHLHKALAQSTLHRPTCTEHMRYRKGTREGLGLLWITQSGFFATTRAASPTGPWTPSWSRPLTDRSACWAAWHAGFGCCQRVLGGGNESERSSARLGRALSGERGHALAGAARRPPDCLRAEPGHLECAQQCAETWRGMWRALCGISDSCLESGEDFNVLFHCFGGINRSPGALRAWLVLDGQRTVDEAVAALRPALCPWQSRDYVLLALNRLRAQKAS